MKINMRPFGTVKMIGKPVVQERKDGAFDVIYTFRFTPKPEKKKK